jgi:hypothetical protein
VDSVRFANQLLIKWREPDRKCLVTNQMRLFPAAPPTIAGVTDVSMVFDFGAARIKLRARTRD